MIDRFMNPTMTNDLPLVLLGVLRRPFSKESKGIVAWKDETMSAKELHGTIFCHCHCDPSQAQAKVS